MQKDTGHLPSLVRDYSLEMGSAMIQHYSIRQRLTTKRPINISPAHSIEHRYQECVLARRSDKTVRSGKRLIYGR